MEKLQLHDLSAPEQKLLSAAVDARKRAYAPYTKYSVGAALFDERGLMFSGCNVESADLTLTSHAEMVAIDMMVMDGGRQVQSMVIVVKSDVGHGMPCGLCRQKIREFSSGKTSIIGVNLNADEQVHGIYRVTLTEILPHSFGPDFL